MCEGTPVWCESLAPVPNHRVALASQDSNVDSLKSLDIMSTHERDLEISRVLAREVRGWAGLLDAGGCSLLVEQLTGGMTNGCYRCVLLGAPPQPGVPEQVLLRVYGEGTSDYLDRDIELAVFRLMSAWNLGPELIAEFGLGRVESFLARHRTLQSQVSPAELPRIPKCCKPNLVFRNTLSRNTLSTSRRDI
eukprot:8313868-Pyramimonas_sp.AAC.1